MTDDIIVRIIDMPYCIKGYTMLSPDGVYNVYLNSKYTYESQKRTYAHEVSHIRHMDLMTEKELNIIEKRARKEAV